MADEFKLKRPCAKCPFRTDVHPYLRGGRAAEIARALAGGQTFYCHATVDHATDDDEPNTMDSCQCAGAMIVLEKQDIPNQMMRIGERLGVYDPKALDMAAPVVDSLDAFISHHGGEALEEVEPCSVVWDHDCEAPAGYMEGGAVVRGTESAGGHCYCCGESVCESCSEDHDEGRACKSCVEMGYT